MKIKNIHWYEEICWRSDTWQEQLWYTIAFPALNSEDTSAIYNWFKETSTPDTRNLKNLNWGEIQVKTEEQVVMFLLKWS
jgi:hypothetical protein